jgi:hypothetical protein
MRPRRLARLAGSPRVRTCRHRTGHRPPSAAQVRGRFSDSERAHNPAASQSGSASHEEITAATFGKGWTLRVPLIASTDRRSLQVGRAKKPRDPGADETTLRGRPDCPAGPESEVAAWRDAPEAAPDPRRLRDAGEHLTKSQKVTADLGVHDEVIEVLRGPRRRAPFVTRLSPNTKRRRGIQYDAER